MFNTIAREKQGIKFKRFKREGIEYIMKSAEELLEINKHRFIDQVCYVTDDYRKTIEYFTEKLDMGPWTIIRNTNQSAHDVEFEGKLIEEDWDFFLAFTKVGDMGIEVIQPVFGPEPYSKFLKEKGPGIHHIKESIYSGDDDLRKYMDSLVEKGHEIIYEGYYMEAYCRRHYFPLQR